MSDRWKRITVVAPEEVVLKDESPAPTETAADEVAGKTLYSLVSSGTEMNIYLGNYDRQGLAFGKLPFVPGYAAVYRVTSIGPEVGDLAPGDFVFCQGTHSSHQKWHRPDVLRLPPGLSPEVATFARLGNIAMSALTTTEARPPARIVIIGQGLVGLMATMIFAATGYEVVAVEQIAERQELAATRGASLVLPAIDSAKIGSVPLVLDCSGHEQAILDSLSIVEPGGEVVLAGVPMVRRTEIYAQKVLNQLFRSRARIRSGKEQQVAEHPTPYRQGSQYGNMAGLLGWLREGRIVVDGLYDRASPADAQEVYQGILHRRSAKIATVFDWGLLE